MKVCVVLKECHGEEYVDWIITNVKDIYIHDDCIEIEYYIDEEMEFKDIVSSHTIPKREIDHYEVYGFNQ